MMACECNAPPADADAGLVEAVQAFFPNIDTGNSNVPDDTIIPLDVTMGELRKLKAALAAMPVGGMAGVELESAGWVWLETQFGTLTSDPVDRVYDASEMVDAFHAGYGRSLAVAEQGGEI